MRVQQGDRRMTTIVLLHLVALLEKADEAFLPLLFKEIGLNWTVAPLALSTFAFYRSLLQAFVSPLAIWLSFRHSRARIVGIGAIGWSLSTVAVGISPSFWVVAISRAANGIGLAVVLPLIQSTLSDSYSQEHRGGAFGMFKASIQCGSVIGETVTFTLSAYTILGVVGWRFACLLASLLSAFLGVMVLIYAKDPCFSYEFDARSSFEAGGRLETLMEDVECMFEEIEDAISVKSFRILVVQSIFDNFALSALSFLKFWYKLMNYSDENIFWLLTFLSSGMTIGYLVGGHVGDRAAWKLPNIGRILCSQFSTGVSIPLLATLFLLLPTNAPSFLFHSLFLFTTGVLSFWGKPACTLPLFTETVSSRLYTTAFTLDLALEKVLAATGAPLVVFLAHVWFGLSTPSEDLIYELELNGRVENTPKNFESLSKSLFLATALSSTLSTLMVTALYWAYPKDRKQARIKAWVEESSVRVWTMNQGFEDYEDHENQEIGDCTDEEESLIAKNTEMDNAASATLSGYDELVERELTAQEEIQEESEGLEEGLIVQNRVL